MTTPPADPGHAAAAAATAHAPLRHLGLPWFAAVMGLAGLALAWLRAVPLMGEIAGALGLVFGTVAAVFFVALVGLQLMRVRRHPQAVAEDLRHPARHAFVATVPVALLLLVAVAVQVAGPSAPLRLLWALGAAGQAGATLWVMARWLRPQKAEALPWAAVTPVLIIPAVGNVVPAMAGPALGLAQVAAAQYAIGLFLWPVVFTLLVVRLAVQGPWPERLLPTTFISAVSPAVAGLGALQLGAPPLVGWAAWGLASFFLAWSFTLLPRLVKQPFTMAFWGMSFPLAAWAGLSLMLASAPGGLPQGLAVLSLAFSTLVIGALALGTVQGLRAGTLLAPEPVALIQPVGAAATPG